MKQSIIICLVVVIGLVSSKILIEKDDEIKDREVKEIEGSDDILTKENFVTIQQKPKCNLQYLACVKKHGGTRKAHIACGKRFVKCKKRCYKKCKYIYKQCMIKVKDEKKCKAIGKKCASKCPHLSRCARKCRATLITCKKNKGKYCLKNFLKCLKACKPKRDSTVNNLHWKINY